MVPPPYSIPPSVPPTPPPPPVAGTTRVLVIAAIAAGLLLGVLAAVLVARRLGRGSVVAQSVVRVVLSTHAGTGFFVAGPDGSAYVVTANHVVDDGERILVEQSVEASRGRRWIEAYPDAEVVAFDADADLAVIRLKGVPADRFNPVRLAAEPVADESVLAYGFPASSLAADSGMVSKPGKVLSLVKFPVVDRMTGEVLRNDAVDGLLVSSEIEPGFSGGPTCNEKGELVGVNVTKDTVHRAQNGAVSVTAVKKLLEQIPATAPPEPTAADVKALLARIQTEYLLLPVERRWTTREQEYVSASDLPRLEELVTTVRRLENDTTKDDKTKLSGQATLGVVLSRLPGRPLETYTDPSTRKALADCEMRARSLKEFFGSLVPPGGGDADSLAHAASGRCGALAFRPLAFDLTALALRWEGKDRGITVGKVDSVDPARHVYRAQVRFDGIDHVVDVWLATDGGRLRLKLFDNEGRPAGLSLVQDAQASAFFGTWHRSEPRAAHDFGNGVDADTATDETLVVSIATDGEATITHQIRRKVYFTGSRRPTCGGPVLDLGIEQSFTGKVHEGSIVGPRQKAPKALGNDMGRCWQLFTYAPDQIAVWKRVGDKLVMYRTDGVAWPEAAEFTR